MTRYVLAIALLMGAAATAFPQELDEAEVLRQLGMGGTFGLGNLAVQDLQRGNDPVQQLKRFFTEAKLPLSNPQVRQLNSIIEAQMKALRATAAIQDEEAVRRANQEFSRKSNEVLTSEQRAELRRYRTEQIMMRGGFPALRFILDSAQTPLTPDQEKQVQSSYEEFNRQVNQLARDSKGAPDRAQLDKLENEALGKVVRVLTPAQRRALAVSRQGNLPRK